MPYLGPGKYIFPSKYFKTACVNAKKLSTILKKLEMVQCKVLKPSLNYYDL